MKYIQVDGSSKGMVVELIAEEEFRRKLRVVSSGMEYTVSAVDFKNHYKLCEESIKLETENIK